MKKITTIILVLLLNIGLVQATLEGSAFGFAKDMSLGYLSSQNPALGKTISFALNPQSAATGEVIGFIGQYDSGLAKAINVGMNPGSAVKGEVMKQVYMQLDPEEQEILSNIEKYKPYVEQAFTENPKAPKEETKGRIEIDDNKNTILKDGEGNVFAIVPKGYEAIENEKGFIIENKKAKEGAVLKIKSYEITAGRGAKVTFSESKTGSTLQLKGKGNVDVGGTQLTNIADAEIELDKNEEIARAVFTTTTAEEYKFIYQEEHFTFKSKKGSLIDFDPRAKEVYAEDIGQIVYKEQDIQAEELHIKLDERGFKEIKLSGGGTYYSQNNQLTYSSEEGFRIYLDGRDITQETHALAILQGPQGTQVNAKGKVKIVDEKDALTYEGKSFKTLTKFRTWDNVFDIQNGDALIDNNKHYVLFEEGKIQLRNRNLAEETTGTPFSFKYTEKKGKNPYYAQFNPIDRKLTVSSIKKGKVQKVVLTSLEEMEERIAKQQQTTQEQTKEIDLEDEVFTLDDQIKEKRTRGEDVRALIKERDALSIKIIEQSIMEEAASGMYKSDMERYQEEIASFEALLDIHEDMNPEMKGLVKARLGELYTVQGLLEKNRDLQPGEPITLRTAHYSILQKAITSYESVITDPAVDKQTQEEAALSIATIYKELDLNKEALEQYNRLSGREYSATTRSKALLGLSVDAAENNKLKEALHYVSDAVAVDSENTGALTLQKDLQRSLVKAVQGKLDVNQKDLFRKFSDKLGTTGYKSGFLADLKQVFGNSANIVRYGIGGTEDIVATLEGKTFAVGVQQKGIFAIEQALDKGFKIEEILNEDSKKRQAVLSETFNLRYVDATELKKAYEKIEKKHVIQLQNPKTRRDFIIKWKGEDIAYEDELLKGFFYSTYDAERNKDIAILKEYGRTKEKLTLVTGEPYIEGGALDKTWGDVALDFVNLETATLLTLPGAQLGVLAKLPGLANVVSAEMTIAGAIGKGLVAVTPGGSSVAWSAQAVKESIASSRLYTAASTALPKTTAVGRFIGAEVAETGLGFAVEGIVPGTGLAAELLAGHNQLFDIAKKAKVIAKSSKVHVGKDGEVLALEYITDTSEQAEELLQQIIKTSPDTKVNKLAQNNGYYVIIDGRSYLISHGILATPDYIEGKKIWTSLSLEEAQSLASKQLTEATTFTTASELPQGTSIFTKKDVVEVPVTTGQKVTIQTGTEAQRARQLLTGARAGEVEIGGIIPTTIKRNPDGSVTIIEQPTQIVPKEERVIYLQDKRSLPEGFQGNLKETSTQIVRYQKRVEDLTKTKGFTKTQPGSLEPELLTTSSKNLKEQISILKKDYLSNLNLPAMGINKPLKELTDEEVISLAKRIQNAQEFSSPGTVLSLPKTQTTGNRITSHTHPLHPFKEILTTFDPKGIAHMDLSKLKKQRKRALQQNLEFVSDTPFFLSIEKARQKARAALDGGTEAQMVSARQKLSYETGISFPKYNSKTGGKLTPREILEEFLEDSSNGLRYSSSLSEDTRKKISKISKKAVFDEALKSEVVKKQTELIARTKTQLQELKDAKTPEDILRTSVATPYPSWGRTSGDISALEYRQNWIEIPSPSGPRTRIKIEKIMYPATEGSPGGYTYVILEEGSDTLTLIQKTGSSPAKTTAYDLEEYIDGGFYGSTPLPEGTLPRKVAGQPETIPQLIAASPRSLEAFQKLNIYAKGSEELAKYHRTTTGNALEISPDGKIAFTYDVGWGNRGIQTITTRKELEQLLILDEQAGREIVDDMFVVQGDVVRRGSPQEVMDYVFPKEKIAASPVSSAPKTAPSLNKITLTSNIKKDKRLVSLAEEATRSGAIQREMNHLTEELLKGNFEAGLGKPGHIKETDIFYLRGRNGARLYYRKTGETSYEIVGKSGKDTNQDKVMNKLQEIYEE